MKTDDRSVYVKRLISEGEHLNQDFKFEISDVRKIAKSLSAFANTDGGRLLIGVKDNGKIAGIRSEEEAYMIEAAANIYCKPAPEIHMEEFLVDGKTVLIADIEKSSDKPVFAKDDSGKYIAYVRVADKNIVATPVHLSIWKQEKSSKGTFVKFTDVEDRLMELLEYKDFIGIKDFCRYAGLPRYKAVNILAKFVRFGIVEMFFCEHQFYWRLCKTLNFYE